MRLWSGRVRERSDLVTLLEKSALFGGTAALSGGMLWIALNHHQRAAGIEDSADDVLRYLRRVTGGQRPEALLELLVERGDEMVRFLEERSPLRFALVPNFPDYRSEWDGGTGGGRSFEPEVCPAAVLGPLREALRPLVTPPWSLRVAEAWRRERQLVRRVQARVELQRHDEGLPPLRPAHLLEREPAGFLRVRLLVLRALRLPERPPGRPVAGLAHHR